MLLPPPLGLQQQQVVATWPVEARRPQTRGYWALPARECEEWGSGGVGGYETRSCPRVALGDPRTRVEGEPPPSSGLSPSLLDILLPY